MTGGTMDPWLGPIFWWLLWGAWILGSGIGQLIVWLLDQRHK